MVCAICGGGAGGVHSGRGATGANLAQGLRRDAPPILRGGLPEAVRAEQAFELVSPSSAAMITSTLPVGVTAPCGRIRAFRVVTCVAAGVVALGGAMIHAGEVALSPAGFALTLVAMSLDVTRLVLVQRLVQPLGLSSVGLMLLPAPLLCVIAAIGAAVLDSGSVAAAASAGEFTALAWSLVFLNGALAVVVNLVIFVFVKVASAVRR